MQKIGIPEEYKEQYKYAIDKAREDRPRYFEWLKNEIEIAIELINKFDKKYVLGGLGARLMKSTPTLYNQFLEQYEGQDKDDISQDELVNEDDEIEVLLEYAMSISTATPNKSSILPTPEHIEEIYQQLSKVKSNINFFELSAESPDGNDFDQWLRTNIMLDSINVRGDGYHEHIQIIFNEIFNPFNGFIEQYYGFNASDVYETIINLDRLVFSKVSSPFGATNSHHRLTEWMDKMGQDAVMKEMAQSGKHFIRQFTEANPDLYDSSAPDMVASYSLDSVEGYGKIFWVIPTSEKEKLIFERISHSFNENNVFFKPPKFKAFPLNDTIVKPRPLIKEDGKYYHFSLNLAFRNIFRIVEELIKEADITYYQNSFKGNSNFDSRDNYIERKAMELFQRIIPNGVFYHSLDYTFDDKGVQKETELDILGISENTAYIIEVKAGELNTKHRRGAIKGLKDRLKETINEGSYQCHRALQYIQVNESPSFDYVEDGTRKTIKIDKTKVTEFYKISVTFEHFSSISANLKYLIESGVLSSDFKSTWIVSLYDLMVFVDILESDDDLRTYLNNRINLYERNDIEFYDEIDILGFYIDGKFPLGDESKERTIIFNFREKIDDYYKRKSLGIPNLYKPKKIGIKKEAPQKNKLTKRKKPRIRTNKQIVERWLKRKKSKRTRIMRKRRKRT